mgnify:CR=1 FL=1
MGLLGEIFDDVVDIASAPLQVAAIVTDEVLDTDTHSALYVAKESIKTDPFELKRRQREREERRHRERMRELS